MTEDLSLEGQVALITGGGSGIGKGTAKIFSSHGCRLILVDQTLAKMEEIAAEIRGKGGEVELIEADVSSAEAMKAACDQGAERFGRLDIVYANAGINGVWAPIDELTPEEFDRTIAVNLRGTFLTIKYSVPHLRKQGGSVLITASVNGTRTFSNTGATAYSASKAGQAAMAKMLAVELGHDKIRVNVICPGAINTTSAKEPKSATPNPSRSPSNTPKAPVHSPERSRGASSKSADWPSSSPPPSPTTSPVKWSTLTAAPPSWSASR